MSGRRWLASTVIAALSLVTALPRTADAMTASEGRRAQLRTALATLETGRKIWVNVRLKNGQQVTGYLDLVGDHSFFVSEPDTGVSTQIAYNTVTRVNASLSTGTKIVIAVGLAAVALFFLAVWASVGQH